MSMKRKLNKKLGIKFDEKEESFKVERISFFFAHLRIQFAFQMAVLWTCLLLVVALMSSAVAGAAVKPQYRARLSCGAVPDDKVRTNRPFPWVVKILDEDGNLVSAGSLILDNLVLTSAQFVNRYATDCCRPSSVC